MTQREMDYERMAVAIRFLETCAPHQPSLEEIARHVHLSPFHFERLFARWAGVTPKKYLQFLTKERAKRLLRESASVLDAAYASGLSGPGRLHDLLVTCEGMTPGEVRRRGEGLVITTGIHASPFGWCVVGLTDRGICALEFVDDETAAAETRLAARWPNAILRRDDRATAAAVARIFAPAPATAREGLRIFLSGTRFQLAVWQALLAVPEGAATTYRSIARAVGNARAFRAVGQTVGANPIAYLIPCHRVLKESGELSGYRWGTERKAAMLLRELWTADGDGLALVTARAR